jgi:hypothetical protein
MSALARRLDRIEAPDSPRIGLADVLRSLNGDAAAKRRVAEDDGRSPLARAVAACRVGGDARERLAIEGAAADRQEEDAADA